MVIYFCYNAAQQFLVFQDERVQHFLTPGRMFAGLGRGSELKVSDFTERICKCFKSDFSMINFKQSDLSQEQRDPSF